MEAQLLLLNAEAARLTSEIKAAAAKWEGAPANKEALYHQIYDDLVAEKKQLESRRETLERQLRADIYRQVDDHRQASLSLGRLGTPMSSNDKMMYANLGITNDRVDPASTCSVDIMLDCGCSMELVLPARKAVQLQLQKMDDRSARGFEGQLVAMTTFASVLVEIVLKAGDDKFIKKKAYLEPSTRTSEYSQALLERRDTPKASWEDYPKRHPDGTLEVSPVKRQCKPEDVANCLLGIDGLRKLRLTVDFENSVIMPVVMEDMILDAHSLLA